MTREFQLFVVVMLSLSVALLVYVSSTVAEIRRILKESEKEQQ